MLAFDQICMGEVGAFYLVPFHNVCVSQDVGWVYVDEDKVG